MNEMVEQIKIGDQVICYLVRSSFSPELTTFVTNSETQQQLGLIVYPAGSTIPRHIHKLEERHLTGISEAIIVRKGRCVLDLYDFEYNLFISRELSIGDVALLTGGGHGFRILDDTVLLEIKQGPYLGKYDKELF